VSFLSVVTFLNTIYQAVANHIGIFFFHTKSFHIFIGVQIHHFAHFITFHAVGIPFFTIAKVHHQIANQATKASHISASLLYIDVHSSKSVIY
jgi:hypothetical protein